MFDDISKYEGRYVVLTEDMKTVACHPLNKMEVAGEVASELAECTEDKNATVVCVAKIENGEIIPKRFYYGDLEFYSSEEFEER